jgi:hypothetical protein
LWVFEKDKYLKSYVYLCLKKFLSFVVIACKQYEEEQAWCFSELGWIYCDF